MEAASNDFVIRFRADEVELDAEQRAILQRAAETYKGGIPVVVTLIGGPPQSSPTEEQVEAAWAYLADELDTWSEPLFRTASGELVSEVVMGLGGDDSVLVLGPRPAPPPVPPPSPAPFTPPPPPPPPPPPSTSPPYRSGERAGRTRSVGGVPVASTLTQAAPLPLEAVRLAGGRLEKRALEAMVAECVRLQGGLTRDCAGAVARLEGRFDTAPPDVRDEFANLLRECPAGGPCDSSLNVAWQYRGLPFGELDPQPRIMTEGETTLFTAFIRDVKEAAEEEAQARIAGSEGGATQPRRERTTLLRYAERMCFLLTARADDFRIKPELPEPRPPGFTLERDGAMCFDINVAAGAEKYQPAWWVTPLRAGDLKPAGDGRRLGLLFLTKVVIDGRAYPRKYRDYPLYVDINPRTRKALLWLDEIIELVTKATALAKAIGLFMAAVAGWGIWKLLKGLRRRRGRKRT